MATKNATIMFYDPYGHDKYKMRLRDLRTRVKRLEHLAQFECPYYLDVSVEMYKSILGLGKIRKIDKVFALPYKYFMIKQIGWYKGVPLMTLDMQSNEWDPE